MAHDHSDTGQPEARPHRHHYDAEMLSVEEALGRILSYFEVLEPQKLPLLEAQGQVLAEDLVAGFDIPSLANSAMDGYAVRAADISAASETSPAELSVIGKVADRHISISGYCTRIDLLVEQTLPELLGSLRVDPPDVVLHIPV